jgi:hypothetical protein
MTSLGSTGAHGKMEPKPSPFGAYARVHTIKTPGFKPYVRVHKTRIALRFDGLTHAYVPNWLNLDRQNARVRGFSDPKRNDALACPGWHRLTVKF